jgi:hypothetical protein
MLAAEEVAQSVGWFLEHAWLIPLIPCVAFAVIILFGHFEINGKRVLRWSGAEVGIASMVAALVIAIGTTYQWIHYIRGAEEAGPIIRSWTWWQIGGIKFGIGEHIDGLAIVMLLLVTFISTLVQIYSLEYVRGDRRFTHFFASLTLFSAGMLTMVLAENMVQLILGWEIMGLCSFLLIGHWWEEEANSRAALKAFLTVRVGDIGLLVGTAIMFGAAGTFSIRGLNEWAIEPSTGHTVLLWTSIALFCACIGKSGQFPLHTGCPTRWRADAGQFVAALVDHGCRRSVLGGSSLPGLPHRFRHQRRRSALQHDRGDRRHHHLDRGSARVRAERHQEGLGLFDRQPARLHDDGSRRRRVGAGRLPHLHPRLLQVLPLPVRRVGVPHRQPSQLRHEEGHGWVGPQDADHVHHLDGLDGRPVRHSVLQWLLLEGRDHRLRRSLPLPRVHDRRVDRCVPHDCVHDARDRLPTTYGEPRAPRRISCTAVTTRTMQRPTRTPRTMSTTRTMLTQSNRSTHAPCRLPRTIPRGSSSCR